MKVLRTKGAKEMRFACRQCRKEVKLDSEGVANHLDGSPSCIPVVGGRPMPDWNRHEVVEDESTLAPPISEDSQKEFDSTNPKKKGGEN
jgi:hypothetical protein